MKDQDWWHGGAPYRIEPQHRNNPIPSLARIDRAIKDVEYGLELVEQCQPPLPADTDPEVYRRRLARAVNLLCSAGRDVDQLQDELLITHASHDVDCLRQRRYYAFEAQPMFHLDSDGGRYFSGRGRSFSGPLTIQEHLRRYGGALREAAWRMNRICDKIPPMSADGRPTKCTYSVRPALPTRKRAMTWKACGPSSHRTRRRCACPST